jgi:aryl sulfotransferase
MSGRYGWLASYPRSGNTWLRLLLEGLLTGGAPPRLSALTLKTPIASRREFDELLGIDSSVLLDDEIGDARPFLHRAIAEAAEDALILRKVHDCCWRSRRGERVFPPELSRGVVYIARDPRDVAVSCARFFGLSLDATILRMNDPEAALAESRVGGSMQLAQPLGAWSRHVESWLDDSGMPHLLLRYEDLLADTGPQLARVATFLGLPAEAADAVAASVTFADLQRQEQDGGFAEQLGDGELFFRRGIAGAWRETLSAAQAERLVDDHHRVMTRLGYL